MLASYDGVYMSNTLKLLTDRFTILYVEIKNAFLTNHDVFAGVRKTFAS